MLEYQWSIRESLRMRVENPIQFIDGAGRKGGFGYDPMSRPIAVTDGSGHTRKEGRHDALNRALHTHRLGWQQTQYAITQFIIC